MALFFPLGVPYRVPYRAPPNKAAGSPDLPLVGWVCNRRLSAWPGLAWLGLAGLAGLAWVWLAFLRIWLDFGLVSAGFCFWLSFTRILLGFELDLA